MTSIGEIKSKASRPRPLQRRSAKTVDRILEVASRLLDAVGFDRLTTNLICEHAGLTPPALYRHFANKYAVMEELGRRLMEEQNTALFDFLEANPDANFAPETLAVLLKAQYEITRAKAGGKWIMRSLHSTPALNHVRLESHRTVVDYLVSRRLTGLPNDSRSNMERRCRIAIDSGYAMIELLLDEPSLDCDAVIADAARMMSMLDTAA